MDERLRVEEEEDYLGRITTHPQEYNWAGYYERLNCFGTLTLIHRTEKPQSAQYLLYEASKQRNEIEMMFDSHKTFLKAELLYMTGTSSKVGFLLIFQCQQVKKGEHY
jgi:hypothetical protein